MIYPNVEKWFTYEIRDKNGNFVCRLNPSDKALKQYSKYKTLGVSWRSINELVVQLDM